MELCISMGARSSASLAERHAQKSAVMVAMVKEREQKSANANRHAQTNKLGQYR